MDRRGVEVVLPRGVPERAADRFVEDRVEWIRARLSELEQVDPLALPERFQDGVVVPFRGRRLRLRVETADLTRAEVSFRTAFLVRLPRTTPREAQEARTREVVVGWLTERATRDAGELVGKWSETLRLRPRRVVVKRQKSRWGSCAADGTLRLNWMLICVPRRIFEYVVVHELCHLAHRDHGPRFWARVAGALPDHAKRRSWLRDHPVDLASG